MSLIWSKGGSTVSKIHSQLNKKREIAYTTVMTIMTRLCNKGFLTRQRLGRAFVYSPQKSRKQTAKNIVSAVFDKLVNQFGEEAVVAFSEELKKANKK